MHNVMQSYKYTAFGLNITSSIPIIGLDCIEFNNPQVYITEHKVPDFLLSPIFKNDVFSYNENEFLLKIANVARFYIKDGNDIIVQKHRNITYDEITAYILSTVFGILLHQRNILPLHASAVLFNNRCILFSGLSGSGKTSIALNLLRIGGKLLADDIAAINFIDQKPFLRSSFPMAKVCEDTLYRLGLSTQGLRPVMKDLKKFYLPIQEFDNTVIPISKIYILQWHNLNSISIQELFGIEKFKSLKDSVFFSKGIKNTNFEKNYFNFLTTLIHQVPIVLYCRPNTLVYNDRLINQIIDDL